MKESFENILDEVIMELESDSNVIGAVLYGSLSKGVEHNYSDIDLMVIAIETDHKTTSKLYGDTVVQIIWRTEEVFREKVEKRVRTIPISKDFKVVIDKQNWIKNYLDSDLVKATWEEPLSLTDRECLLMSIDFSTSLNQLMGLKEQGKTIETEVFISEYIYLGLELLYNKKKWFLNSKKYLIEDIKNRLPELWRIINKVFNAKTSDGKIESYRDFYEFTINIIDKAPSEYSIVW